MKKIHYLEAVHFLPLPHITQNVRCLNGSAHIKRTSDITLVTCELCKNPETAKAFWQEKANGGKRGF